MHHRLFYFRRQWQKPQRFTERAMEQRACWVHYLPLVVLKPLREGVQLPPAEWAKHKLQCRQTHLAFNLIFFTYLKSLHQRILLKKRIDQNAVIRSSKMIWSSSQSCSRLRIRSQGPFSSLANWITSHCNTKGSLFPSCQTHKRHAHFIDEERCRQEAFPWHS